MWHPFTRSNTYETDPLQCIVLGALLNQTMFLILIGLLKGKSGAQIVQSFHDVSLISRAFSCIWLMITHRNSSNWFGTRTKSGRLPTFSVQPIVRSNDEWSFSASVVWYGTYICRWLRSDCKLWLPFRWIPFHRFSTYKTGHEVCTVSLPFVPQHYIIFSGAGYHTMNRFRE